MFGGDKNSIAKLTFDPNHLLPAGNGAHFGRYLRDGDVMEGTISEIGTIRNQYAAARQAL